MPCRQNAYEYNVRAAGGLASMVYIYNIRTLYACNRLLGIEFGRAQACTAISHHDSLKVPQTLAPSHK